MTKIGEGTYGCVYSPAPPGSCTTTKTKTKTQTSQRPTVMVTKVQRADTAANELAIGKLLTTIPGYKYHFAPLEHACNLSIQTITSDAYQSCEPLQRAVRDPETTFVQSNARFVGHRTIDTFLGTASGTPHRFPAVLLQTYRHAQRGLHKLRQHRIVHYDLHEGNILYDETYGVPIIIDFGMAFQVPDTTTTPTPLANFDVFFSTDVDFPPWCIEVVLLSQLKAHPDAQEKDLVDTAERFVQLNPACRHEPEVAQSILTRVRDTYAPLAPSERVQCLLNTWEHWDQYALAVIYLNVIVQTPEAVQQACAPLVNELLDVMLLREQGASS